MRTYDRLEIHLSDETTSTKFLKLDDVKKWLTLKQKELLNAPTVTQDECISAGARDDLIAELLEELGDKQDV